MTSPDHPQHSSDGPLKGIRIVDLSRFISGPYCAMMLGDMGAEVIKIEKPGTGEVARSYAPSLGATSLYSMVYNRNKKSLPIDTRKPEGQRVLRELIAQADVVLENFRPGTMEKMGCSWDVLSRENPQLIMARISGFGQTGPYSELPCFDAIAQAMSGLMDLTGEPDGPPTISGTFMCDYVTANYAAIGVLAALQGRERTGRGQVVDVSLLDSAVSMLMTAIPSRQLLGQKMTRRGNRDPYGPPTASYQSADGEWIYIYAGTLFKRFAAAMGRPELLQDPRFCSFEARQAHSAEVEKIAADWMASKTCVEALAILRAAEVPCAKVATIDDVIADPQLRHRDQIVDIDHPGVGPVPMQGVTIRLSETPLSIQRPIPALGQDSREVLSSWLGYTAEQTDALVRDAVIQGDPSPAAALSAS